MDTNIEYCSSHEIMNNLSQNKLKSEDIGIKADIMLNCPFSNCQKKYKSKRTMGDHLRIHNGEKLYVWYYLLQIHDKSLKIVHFLNAINHSHNIHH